MLKIIFKKWDKFEKKTTKKFTKQQRKYWEVLIFITRFVLLAAPLHFLIWLNFDAYILQDFTSDALEKTLSYSSIEYERNDIFFTLNTQTDKATIEISKDCVAWKSLLALTGLIFAVRRIKLRKRIYGVLIGIPLIFIGNLIRLYTTFYLTAIKGIEIFTILHSFLWQWGLIFLVLGIWILWLDKISK